MKTTSKLLYNSHSVKIALCNILSQELKPRGQAVNISFVWMYADHVFSFRLCNDREIDLRINLSAVKKLIQQYGYTAGISYCAYFISSYIEQIDASFEKMPVSYFEGLALLDAICDCRAQKVAKVYSPTSLIYHAKRSFCLRPIEVSAAICSLKRVSVAFADCVTASARVNIERLTNELLLYSRLPEISYAKSFIPAHTLFSVLNQLREMMTANTEWCNHFAVFRPLVEVNISKLTLRELLERAFPDGNCFEQEAVLRLLCYANTIDIINENEAYMKCFQAAANAYRNQSVLYAKEVEHLQSKLLEDNLSVIENTAQKINHIVGDYGIACSSGTIHSFK